MKTNKIIGFTLLLIVFGVIFSMTAYENGIYETLISFCGALIVGFTAWFGVFLILKNR